MPTPPPQPARRTRLEAWIVTLVALVVAALAVGRPLVDSSLILPSVGAATAHEPWRRVIPEAQRAAEREDLSDQGVAFYPAYRYTAERILSGELPHWNPNIFAGVPWLANPQWRVLDPQFWVHVGLEALLGREGFDWGFAGLAWLRLAAAGIGSWWLARRLGLGRGGATLAGLSFALSGISLTWLGFPVGHVTFLAPWLLLAIERARDPGARTGVVVLAITTALVILGGHPESSFFVCLFAGFWCLASLREDPRAAGRALIGMGLGVALSAPMWIPFAEYLGHSAALHTHRAAARGGELDLALTGVLLLFAGATSWLAGWRSEDPERELPLVLVFVPISAALWLALSRFGLDARAGGLIFDDLFGLPGRADGYRGPAAWIEFASPWLSTAALVPALAALLDRRAVLGRRVPVIVLGVFSLGLVLRLPGLIELWQSLPLVGQAATERAAPLSALMLSLLAGAGIERASMAARGTAALSLAVAAAMLWIEPTHPHPETKESGPTGEILALIEAPPERFEAGPLPLAGWIHPGLKVDRARLQVTRIDPKSGRSDAKSLLECPLELSSTPAGPSAAMAPAGATHFRLRHLEASHLDPGRQRLEIVLLRGEEELGRRYLGTTEVVFPRAPATMSLVLAALAALVACLAPRRLAWVGASLLVVLQGLSLAQRAISPSPRAAVFPESRTTELLRENATFGRTLGGPGVLPYDTALVHGLSVIDGYDALDVASFDAYRPFAMRPGAHPILDWNAAGVDLDSPAFRLLAVHQLALVEPLPETAPREQWQLVAGPVRDAGAALREAELFVYRALDPLPRAFVVSELVEREQVLSDPGSFDPRRQAFLEPGVDVAFAQPCTRAAVQIDSIQGSRVSLRAELNGDGLLVLADQSYPGWRVEVDGQERSVLTVNSLLRAVVLPAGEHEVVFRYRPRSWWWGIGVALAGAMLTLFSLRRPVRLLQ